MAPPVIAATTFLTLGLAMGATGFDPAAVLTTVLVLAVMSASVFPWLALESTGTMVRPLNAPADVTADPRRSTRPGSRPRSVSAATAWSRCRCPSGCCSS